MNRVKVISEVEAELSDYVVCTPVAGRPADRPLVRGSRQGTCSVCRQPVWFAPSAPILPPKICVPCMLAKVEAERPI